MPTGPKPPIPNGVAKIIHEGTVFLRNWANIFYMLLGTSGTPTAADVLSLATAAHNAYGTHLQPWKTTGSVLHTTKAIYVPTTGSELVGEYATDVAGATTSTPLSNNAASVASWLTDQYYRGGHPRTYFDGNYAASTVDPSTWSNGFITGLEGFAVAYIAALNAFSSTHFTLPVMGTVSYARHNVWRPAGIHVAYFGVTVHPRIDSQRRRLGKEVI